MDITLKGRREQVNQLLLLQMETEEEADIENRVFQLVVVALEEMEQMERMEFIQAELAEGLARKVQLLESQVWLRVYLEEEVVEVEQTGQ